MNSSKDILKVAAQIVPSDIFRYTLEFILDRASGRTVRRIVARRADTNLVVWMKLNVPDGSRYVYVLAQGMLAKLSVTDKGVERGSGYDGDEWLVGASPIWVWKGPFLPDGVSPERPIVWAPFIPPNATFADLNLARQIIEAVHPALVWWPDRIRPDAEIGAVQPPRSKPHLIRYVGL